MRPYAPCATKPTGNPWLSMTGPPRVIASSRGSRARSTGTGGMHDEGVTTLRAQRSRLAAAGADFSDAVRLRTYPFVGDDLRRQLAW